MRGVLLTMLFLAGASAARPDQDPLPGYWITDDLQAAFTQARNTGKPVLIVFRCPP